MMCTSISQDTGCGREEDQNKRCALRAVRPCGSDKFAQLLMFTSKDDPFLREIWPLAGPSNGGTQIWVHMSRAQRGSRIIFSFGEHRPRVHVMNVSLATSDLQLIRSPPLPLGVRAPCAARVYISGMIIPGANGQGTFEEMDKTPGMEGLIFRYWDNENPPGARSRRDCRTPHADKCTDFLPTILFDSLAGVEALPRPSHWAALRPRALPPRSSCSDWGQMLPVSHADCKRIGSVATIAHAQRGVHGRGYSRSHSPTIQFVESRQGDQRNGSCVARKHKHQIRMEWLPLRAGCGPHGSYCVCFGPGPGYREHPCADSVLSRASELAPVEWDSCGPATRRCIAQLRRTLPAIGYHEFEGGCSTAVDTADKHMNARQISLRDYVARPARSLDIVVSAYSTPVGGMLCTLLGALSSRIVPQIWFYHKGNSVGQRDQAKVAAREIQGAFPTVALHMEVGLPNVGRCDHTYLRHILRRYNSLADTTLFLKDTTMRHAHLGYASKLLTWASRLGEDAIADVRTSSDVSTQAFGQQRFWCARRGRLEAPDFETPVYRSELCRNAELATTRGVSCYQSDSTFVRATVKPLHNWLVHHHIGGRKKQSSRRKIAYCGGGVFAGSRNALRSTPNATYAALTGELEKAGANSEAGHFMERSWAALLGVNRRTMRPLKSTLAIVSTSLAKYGHTSARVATSPCIHFAARHGRRVVPQVVPHIFLSNSEYPGGVVRCLFFASAPAAAKAATIAGWEVQHHEIFSARAPTDHMARFPQKLLSLLELQVAPHRLHKLRWFDFLVYVDPGATLNLPAVFEIISGHAFTLGGSLLALNIQEKTPSESETPQASSSEALVIIRRNGERSRTFGEWWWNMTLGAAHAATPHALLQYHFQSSLLSALQLVPAPLRQLITYAGGNGRSKPHLLTTVANQPLWWQWWICRRGHILSIPGRARMPIRLSERDSARRCCKPNIE